MAEEQAYRLLPMLQGLVKLSRLLERVHDNSSNWTLVATEWGLVYIVARLQVRLERWRARTMAREGRRQALSYLARTPGVGPREKQVVLLKRKRPVELPLHNNC